MADSHRLVEGDGLVTNFFYFLWKRKSEGVLGGSTGSPPASGGNQTEGDRQFPWSGAVEGCTPEFLLPSTVIFEHNYPKAWYHPHQHGSKGWDLDRKLGKDIDSSSILRHFCPRSAAAAERLRAEGGDGGAGPAGSSGNAAGGLLSQSSGGLLDAQLAQFEEHDVVAAYFSTARSHTSSVAASQGSATTLRDKKKGDCGATSAATPHPVKPPSAPSTAGRHNRPAPLSHPDLGVGGAGHSAPSVSSHHNANSSGAAEGADDGELRTVVEYMNEPQLREFLLRRTKREDGFLQKWVWPNGKHNNVIQAIWTTHMCLVTRRTNRNAVRDGRVSMYERAVTYEGPAHLSYDTYVAPHIQYQIERFCLDTVKYMYEEHRIPIRRMVLYFKLDWSSQVWLLWASSIRVHEKTQLNLTLSYVARHELQHEENALAEKQAAISGGKPRSGGGGGDGTAERHQSPILIDPVPGEYQLSKFLARQPPQIQQFIHRVEHEKKLTNIAFPASPSMGPIGELYTWGSLIDPFEKDVISTHAKRDARRAARKKRRQSKGLADSQTGTPGCRSARSSHSSPRLPPSPPRPPLSARALPMAPAPPPSSFDVPPSSAASGRHRRRKTSVRRSPRSPRQAKVDEMLRQLRNSETLHSPLRHTSSGAHSASGFAHADTGDCPEQRLLCRQAREDLVAAMFRRGVGQQVDVVGGGRLRVPPVPVGVRWKLLRSLVLSGAFRRYVATVDAIDFLLTTQYEVASYYLAADDLLTMAVPVTIGRGVPLGAQFEWTPVTKILEDCGLEVYAERITVPASVSRQASPGSVRGAGGQRRTSSIPRRASVAAAGGTPAEPSSEATPHQQVHTAGLPENDVTATPNALPVGAETFPPPGMAPAESSKQLPSQIPPLGLRAGRSSSVVVLPHTSLHSADDTSVFGSGRTRAKSAVFGTALIPSSPTSPDRRSSLSTEESVESVTDVTILSTRKPVAEVQRLMLEVVSQLNRKVSALQWLVLSRRVVAALRSIAYDNELQAARP